jgi:hypothetical protein
VALAGAPTEGEDGARAMVAAILVARGLEDLRNLEKRAGAERFVIHHNGEEY